MKAEQARTIAKSVIAIKDKISEAALKGEFSILIEKNELLNPLLANLEKEGFNVIPQSGHKVAPDSVKISW